jgi:hypothetical protein
MGVLPVLASVATAASLAVALEPSQKELKFSERVVAGGLHDFMTVRHLRLRGSQQAIGRKLAEIAQSRHGVELVRLDPPMADHRLEFYRSAYPMHYQRALGVKGHFGTALSGGLDATVLPYNLPNNFGCSVVYYPPSHCASGHATLSRNYDWSTGTWADLLGPSAQKDERRTTEDPYVIEMYPDHGYPSLYLCAYELLGGCFDGVNSKGLTVALLANNTGVAPTPSNAWEGGLSEVEIGRYLLENCTDVEEARQALASIDFYYALVACHYIIGDRDGNSFVWEYSVNRKRRYVVDGKGGPQWVTNHPIHARAYPTAESIPASLTSSTFARFRRLNDDIRTAPIKRTLDDIKHVNRCVRAVGQGTVPTRTLWHAIYDCHDKSLEIDFYLGENGANGKEKRSGYLRFELEH